MNLRFTRSLRPEPLVGWVLGFLLLVAGAPVAHSEVRASAPDGFLSVHTLTIEAPQGAVFKTLTKGVSRWWNAEHSYSGDARNFRLPAIAGGCFCERLPDGGSVEHMRVVFVQPGRELRLAGGLGPLQSLGVSGSMSFRLLPGEHAAETVLEYSYRVSGSSLAKLEALAGPVDAVQLDQLERLKRWVERR